MLVDCTYTPTGIDVSYVHDRKFYMEHFKVADYPNMFPQWHVTDGPGIEGWKNWNDKNVELRYGDKFSIFERIQFLKGLPKEHFDRIHGYSEIPLLAVDFEMEIDEGFPEAEHALTPIISAAITKDDDCLTTTLMTIDPIDEKIVADIKRIVNEYLPEYNNGLTTPVHIISYPNEKEMLKSYLELVKPAPAITGWNFTGYDVPYLENRLKLYGMDMSGASPKGTINWRKEATHTWVEDYMYMFKEKSSWMIKNCERFGLDYVSKNIVGLGKLPFPHDPDTGRTMTMKKLRTADLAKFLAYNVIDTALVQLIHRQVNSYASAYQLASLSFTSLNECLAPTKHSSGILCDYFVEHEPGVVVARRDNVTARPYPGGYVKQPVRHFARHLACFDYSSLYPSLIRTHNLSPANFIRKIKPNEVSEYAHDPNYTITASGSLYKNDKEYFYKAIQTELYNKRKSWQITGHAMIQECVNPLIAEIERRGLKPLI